MDRYYIKGNGGFVVDKTGPWVKYSDHKVALNEAVKAEREACALECDKISTDFAGVKWSLADTAAEAIRARIK